MMRYCSYKIETYQLRFRENAQKCHIKAEFSKVKALDYMLQKSSVAPLTTQCVHLKHCRLTIDLYLLFYLFPCLFTKSIIIIQ